MPQMKFNLDTLKNLDFGTINAAFEHHLQRAVDDCFQRPEDDKPRTVALQFKLTPEMTKGSCDSILVECEFLTKVPNMRTKPYRMTPIVNKGKGDGLLFHPDLPDSPDGTTVMDIADSKFQYPETEKKGG